ncbi:hypothetical protein ABTM79_19450, partial [Acinetobacter baumannii]
MKARMTLVCSTAVLALVSGGGAWAQQAAATGGAPAAAPADEAIVVTGLRASLQRSQAVKQNST